MTFVKVRVCMMILLETLVRSVTFVKRLMCMVVFENLSVTSTTLGKV